MRHEPMTSKEFKLLILGLIIGLAFGFAGAFYLLSLQIEEFQMNRAIEYSNKPISI